MAPPYYTYTPLAPETDQIRLLTLLPASDESGQIVITLRDSPTKAAAQQYEALSYVWGPADNADTITVATSSTTGSEDTASSQADSISTADLHVTENLAVALRHLRLRDAARTLWIDAICIDQQNVAERSEQVDKMGEIYRSAARVVIWLGPASPDSHIAMGLVGHLGHILRFDRLSGKFTLTSNEAADSHWTDITEPLPYNDAEQRAMDNFFERPWFDRLWVVQEVLNSQQAIVVCGRHETLWQCVMAVMSCLGRKGITASRGMRGMTLATRLLRMEAVFDKCDPLDLIDLVDRTTHLRCADNRDRVYALLSLAENVVDIKPDYSLSTIQVFRDLVMQSIDNHDARFLANCELNSRRIVGPSWIPDWTVERMTRPIYRCFGAGFVWQSIAESPAEGSIRLSAVPVGTVSNADVVSIPSMDYSQIMSEIVRLLPVDVESSTYKTGCSLLEAFSGTLICSSFRPHVPPNPRLPTLQASMDAVRACLPWINGARFEETDENCGYLSAAYILTKNRAFFKTEKGHIGLAPSNVKVGDTILAILACTSYIIVRPAPGNEGRYNVVGEAFLYGLNDGEAVIGPLPDHFNAEYHWHPGRLAWFQAYRDTRTAEVSWIDPRLEAMGFSETDEHGIPLCIALEDLEEAGIPLLEIELV